MYTRSTTGASLLTLLALLMITAGGLAAQAEHGSPDLDQLEAGIFERINSIRATRGLTPLRRNPDLDMVARDYSRRMHEQDFVGHVDPAGRTVSDRVADTGLTYSALGENIAHNQNLPEPASAAVNGWMTSRGHRANILNPSYDETGVGVWQHNDTFYFTQIFLAPSH